MQVSAGLAPGDGPAAEPRAAPPPSRPRGPAGSPPGGSARRGRRVGAGRGGDGGVRWGEGSRPGLGRRTKLGTAGPGRGQVGSGGGSAGGAGHCPRLSERGGGWASELRAHSPGFGRAQPGPSAEVCAGIEQPSSRTTSGLLYPPEASWCLHFCLDRAGRARVPLSFVFLRLLQRSTSPPWERRDVTSCSTFLEPRWTCGQRASQSQTPG